MRWLLRAWPAAAWGALIFIFSTSYFSSEHTAGVIIPILHWLFPGASLDALLEVHHWIRKSAHFIEFFVFSLLLLRAIRGERQGLNWRWALLAIGIAAAYAGLDEFHQVFVPNRVASPWDALIDTSGAVVAQAVAGWNAYRNGKARDAVKE